MHKIGTNGRNMNVVFSWEDVVHPSSMLYVCVQNNFDESETLYTDQIK